MRLFSSPAHITRIEPEHEEAFLNLLCLGFQLDPSLARQGFYDDPQYLTNERWGLWAGGTEPENLASILTITPSSMHIGSHLFPTAGIAGVTTKPENRRRGYASRLLTHVLQTMPEYGYLAAALIPFDHDFYRQLGWETVGTLFRWRVPVRQLPRYSELAHMRRFEFDDIPVLQRLYATHARLHAGRIARDELRWHYLLWNNRRKWVWQNGEQAEGYLIYDVMENGDVVRPREAYWETDAARRGIVGWLAQNLEGARIIEFNGTPHDLQRWQLSYHDRAHTTPDHPLAQWEAMPNLMWRVVNVPTILEHLLVHLPQNISKISSQSFTFHIRDVQCRWNETPLTVLSDKNEWQLDEGITVKQTVKMDIRVFSMLAIGAVSPSEAWVRHWLKAPEALLPILETFFPRREPCLQLIDYF
jgi:predicted acetyltransferase